MTNKQRFISSISRFQNYYSHKETKMSLLEKAFGEDTVIMDLDGVEEILSTICDMASLMFPNIKEEVLKDYIEWYVYEAVDMNEPEVSEGDKKWIIKSSENLYDVLEYFDKENLEYKKEN